MLQLYNLWYSMTSTNLNQCSS